LKQDTWMYMVTNVMYYSIAIRLIQSLMHLSGELDLSIHDLHVSIVSYGACTHLLGRNFVMFWQRSGDFSAFYLVMPILPMLIQGMQRL